MKINTALVDAVMMLSFITLVLVGTSEFENNTQIKDILMITVGILSVAMIALRILSGRKQIKE